jgi:hypothetical protein
MIFARTSTGSSPELNIRQIILAESPVPLCLAERIVQAVLRGNPNTFACAFSEKNPAVISASHEDRRSVRYCFGFCCLSGPISWPSPVRGCRRATSAVRACPSCGPALVAEGLCLLARRFHRVQRRARARRRRAILRGLDSTVSSPPSSSGFSIFGAVGGADVPSFLSGRRITASSGLRQGQSLSHRV